MNENDETKVEDIIMVYSNGHRMLYRKKPWIIAANLKNILKR
ncbi:hypothetical protein [Paraclostridium sordellii]|nr:hypothetical protein [Paeniclostridium sordellii]